ncbi:MAG: hypothetical protein GY865_17370, partial [candidate division Zixibacteria bacterium]|nr:hypothetical protein [candidate division Zixibacteria bacterium]
LHLSPEGIYGVDISGTEWEYDFSRDKFVDEELDDFRSSTSTTFGRDELRADLDELKQLEKLADLEGVEGLSAEQAARISEHAAELVEQALVKRYKGLQLRSVTVEADEVVHSSISSIGEVTVKGTVEGDVVSYSRVTITSTGLIEGDVRAPEIVKMRGGTILGERHESDIPPPTDIIDFEFFEKTSYTALIAILIIFFSFMFFSLIGVGVAAKPINRVKLCLEQQFVKSFFIGFAGWFALGPLMAILVLTIIGIPVAVLVLPLALFFGIILGILGASQLTGQFSGRYLGMKNSNPLKQIIPGLTILFIAWIAMSLLMISSSGVAEGFSIFFRVIAIVIWSIVVTAGIGAVVLTRFGSREYKKPSPDDVRVHVNIHTKPKPPTPPPTPPPLNPKDGE